MSYILRALFFASILVSSGSIVPLAFAQNATILSPLKQFKNGVSPQDVICKQGLVLLMRTLDGSPACVKLETAQKLVERGWGVLKGQTSWFGYRPISCQRTPWDQYSLRFARAFTEAGLIKLYFTEQQGITIIESMSTAIAEGRTPPPCGQPEDYSYYFLVPVSEVDKMLKLGYEKVNTIPSSAYLVGS